MVGIKNESANSDDVISGEGVSSILSVTDSPEASPLNPSHLVPANELQILRLWWLLT
ncbi:MAG: hypothetical protein GDA56_04945 [Hormoscilla sp. GM7CHS1pb]|nr:hypothetical protein [Hormoscilla sp. GM7CHS1pb]